MTTNEIRKLYERIPRCHIGFYPTPFHKLKKMSEKYGVDLFMKREDLSGPSNFGGNKIRKAEFIIGQAIEEGVECFVTSGGYQSNSAMELAAAAKLAGIETVVCLYDTLGQGLPEEYRANLLLDQVLDIDIRFLENPDGLHTDSPEYMRRIKDFCGSVQKEQEKRGKRTWYVPTGCAYGNSFLAHVWTYIETVEQAKAERISLDYIYHTTGTGGTLPGLIAGKLLTGERTKIRSVSVNHYGPELICSHEMIRDRVKHVFRALGLEEPSDEAIMREIDVDEGFVGKGYGIPSDEGTTAIREMAKEESIFLDPVYTGKGFAGVAAQIRSGRIPRGSSVAFIHTGGTGALFAEPEMIGNLLKK